MKGSIDQDMVISNEGLEYLIQNGDAQTGKNLVWTDDYRVELPVRVKKEGEGAVKPITMGEMFKNSVKKYGEELAFTFQSMPKKWLSMTFKQYYAQVNIFAKALIALKISQFTAVAIMGFNSPEWAIAFYGSIIGHYIPIGMYTTNSPEVCEYTANHSNSELIVVEDAVQLKKYYGIIDKCQSIRFFVVYKGEIPKDMPSQFKGKVLGWKEFMGMGNNFKAAKQSQTLEYREAQQKPGNCASFIYTSGTTGMPKAVMLSHDSYVWVSEAIGKHYNIHGNPTKEKGRILSYLPLSHVAGQLVDLLVPLMYGFNTFFPDASALQTGLVEYLQIAKPTTFLGVPRVWEKMEEKLLETFATATGMKKKLIDWALSIGYQGTIAEQTNQPLPKFWSLAKKLIFTKIKIQLGLSQTTDFMFGAAPLKEKTRKFFMSLNFFLQNNYGMSETAGPHTVTSPSSWTNIKNQQKICGEAGKAMKGVEVKIINQDNEGNGEICMKGRNIFMGYYKNEKETINTIDKNGYVHSGDVGLLDQNGTLFITGRIKELIITAGGENIPPVLIEYEILAALPIASQVVLIGEKRKYLTVLVCLKMKNATELTQEVVEILKSNGSKTKTIAEAVKCEIVHKLIKSGIDAANKKAISNAQKVHKFTLLDLEFSVDNGILTPTMKLKRKVVSQKFSNEIEAMYLDSKL